MSDLRRMEEIRRARAALREWGGSSATASALGAATGWMFIILAIGAARGHIDFWTVIANGALAFCVGRAFARGSKGRKSESNIS